MFAIASLLAVVAISLVVTRVATVILVATGLSRQSARFQARSAFTGAGFTTKESEDVLAHPLRRRVIMALMVAGQRRDRRRRQHADPRLQGRRPGS